MIDFSDVVPSSESPIEEELKRLKKTAIEQIRQRALELGEHSRLHEGRYDTVLSHVQDKITNEWILPAILSSGPADSTNQSAIVQRWMNADLKNATDAAIHSFAGIGLDEDTARAVVSALIRKKAFSQSRPLEGGD